MACISASMAPVHPAPMHKTLGLYTIPVWKGNFAEKEVVSQFEFPISRHLGSFEA
jgi:hypothetical protein